ncbi:MAG: STAS domain-containing protein [Verrucomicrobiota bacterium]
MQSNGDQGATILAGRFHNVVWVRVEGKGSFKNSPELKNFAAAMIDRGNSQLVVDLKNCPVMDSTFMGTLTGIALKLKGSDEGSLQVINPNDRNRQLLESLGLDQIFDLDVDGSTWQSERALVEDNLLKSVAPPGLNKEEHSELVLEAHEALCKANDDNVRRFKDVIEYLKNDLEDQS